MDSDAAPGATRNEELAKKAPMKDFHMFLQISFGVGPVVSFQVQVRMGVKCQIRERVLYLWPHPGPPSATPNLKTLNP